MKIFVFGFAALSVPFSGSAADAHPVNKMIQLLTKLEANIKAEGVEAHKGSRRVHGLVQDAIDYLTFPVRNRAK